MRYEYTAGEFVGTKGVKFLMEVDPIYYGKDTRPRRKARFECSCGVEFESVIDSVKRDSAQSCGCLNDAVRIRTGKNKKTHGMTGSSLHNAWLAMKGRCFNVNNQDYESYGGRGIVVEEPWKSSFEAFLEDMGDSHSKGLSLDRIDVNGNYCKENCRWTTDHVQAWNQRVYKNNSSGKAGVTWNNKGGKWEVRISKEGTDYSFGFYSDVYEAIRVREKAELDLYGAIKNKFTFPEDISN